VRAGHVTKGYHRLQQDDTQAPMSDSDRASRSGSGSDELDLDSDIGISTMQYINTVKITTEFRNL